MCALGCCAYYSKPAMQRLLQWRSNVVPIAELLSTIADARKLRKYANAGSRMRDDANTLLIMTLNINSLVDNDSQ